jgi:hypothetical protein
MELRRAEDVKQVMLPMEEYERVYRDNPEMLSLVRQGLPSHRDWDEMLQGIVNDLLSGLPEETRRFVSGQVVAGELFIKKGVGAFIRSATSPYKGYVIVVHCGLRALLHSLGKVVLTTAETTPGTYVGPPPCVPKGSDWDALRFLCHVFELLKERKMPHLPLSSLVLQDTTLSFLALLEVYGMAFVLGHELGHLLCGHMARNPSRELELEADRFSLALLLNWLLKDLKTRKLRDDHIKAALAGVDLVLVCQRILEDLGLCDLRNHPPMADRFNALREASALPDAAYELPNTMMKKALWLRNQAVRLGTEG